MVVVVEEVVELGGALLPVQVEAVLAVVRRLGAQTQHYFLRQRQGRVPPHHALAPHLVVLLVPLQHRAAAAAAHSAIIYAPQRPVVPLLGHARLPVAKAPLGGAARAHCLRRFLLDLI